MVLDLRLANDPRWFIAPPEDFDLRVPEEIRQCVVFVGVPVTKPDGVTMLQMRGTAFFVSVPSETSKEISHIYLVTAAHVARTLEGHRSAIRANTKDGGSTVFWIPENLKWIYHPVTPDLVDVAVIPWAPPDLIEYKHITSGLFLTDETIRAKSIGTGDEVFLTGLFAHLTGTTRNLPIVRMGSIAMMPSEPVPSSLGEIEAYLIEARSIGGVSGSPVFVRETIPLGRGGFHLLGLMHGHWDIPPEAKNDGVSPTGLDGAGENSGSVNMGIAIVVPAKKIGEVLNHPDQIEKRRVAAEDYRRTHQPSLDEAGTVNPTE